MKPYLAELNAYCGGLSGKRILDVGCDWQGTTVKEIADAFVVKEAVGMGLNISPKQLGHNVRIEHGDIREPIYEPESFDIVVSASAFEHIYNLDAALKGMYNVLKPGGVLWARFGPIWSCYYGHHLWFRENNELINYWNVLLPPFCHLLMSPNELYAKVVKDHHVTLAQRIVNFVFHDEGQNHFFFEDYRAVLYRSQFNVLVFAGYYDPKAEEIYAPELHPETFERLLTRYPNHCNFFAQGIFTLLRKE